LIVVTNLTVASGSFRIAGLDFEVPAGSYTVLMGRTGSGKTSLLETLAGLLPPLRGKITIGGKDVTGSRPADRGIGYVPQDGALFPTMTVAEHLAFALRVRKRPRAEIEARVAELAGLLNLTQLLARKPRGLSGGERQRVALGRAMAGSPAVLLLDEPLSALDQESREELYTVLQRVHAESGVTLLHVTHDHEDARRLAERVLRIEGGAVLVQSQESRECE
jgi:molybdate/tungstate transport system ATP-binding protein